MNRTQKAAIYGFFLVGLMLLIPLIDLVDTKINPILLRVIGYPLAVLMVLPAWLLSRKYKKDEVQIDERDKMIVKRALLVAGGLVCVGLLIFYAVLIFTRGPGEKVEISTLPAVVFFSFVAFLLIVSSAVLIQYGRGGKQNE
jgi:uncharacterized membrane protein YiaA